MSKIEMRASIAGMIASIKSNKDSRKMEATASPRATAARMAITVARSVILGLSFMYFELL